MKLIFYIDATPEVKNIILREIDWALPVIPRIGESIFIYEIFNDLPCGLEGYGFRVFDIEWEAADGIIYPKICVDMK